MPLIKSPKKAAVGKNIETEMEAGKPQKQSIAIALSTQKAAKSKKKMALGGPVEGPTHTQAFDRNPGTPAPKPDNMKVPESESMANHFAEGGSVDHAKMAQHHMDTARHYMRGGDVTTADQHYKMADQHRAASTAAPEAEYADGGPVKPKQTSGGDYQAGMPGSPGQKFTKYVQDLMGGTEDAPKKKAEGGMIGSDKPTSIAGAIMSRKKMADGGMVDLEANAEEDGNEADELNMEALGKENYSEESGLVDLTSPEDSNEHSDEISSDSHDMVSKLRARMKARRGF